MIAERFVPQGGTTKSVLSRRITLTYHFSRFIPPATYTFHFAYVNSEFSVGVPPLLYVYRYERIVQTIHMQMRERRLEKYVVQAYTYQIKKEKVNSLLVKDGRIFVRKLVHGWLLRYI